MSIYVIVAVNVEDAELYNEYIEAGTNSVLSSEAEIVAVDDNPGILEGSLPGRRVVMLKFPDRSSLDAWYQSDAYQAARAIRLRSANTPFAMTVEGVRPEAN